MQIKLATSWQACRLARLSLAKRATKRLRAIAAQRAVSQLLRHSPLLKTKVFIIVSQTW
jgi:hypothetical protein